MVVALKKKIKKILKYIGLYGVKPEWPTPSEKEKKVFKRDIKLKSSIDTLTDIRSTIIDKKRGAYLRFGDGDLYLLLGFDDLYHKANNKLSKEMKEAFKLEKGILHKTLPINSKLFGLEEGMKKDMHLISDVDVYKYLKVAKKYIKSNTIYSVVALHQLSIYNQKFCIEFLNFLKSQAPVFVGNGELNSDLIKKLFSEIHIKTPSNNSYSEIDRIEQELTDVIINGNNEFRVVVVAMGCAGRILQKRIIQKGLNVYLFDFGSLLDALNGDNSRLWIDIAGMDSLNTILDKIEN
jgi:hypothetical protein